MAIVDYELLVETFAQIVSTYDSEYLISILLYGSVARGDYRPGESDVIDAVVVFKEEVFISEDLHKRAISAILEGCRSLTGKGIPFHPCHYLSRCNGVQSALAFYLPAWNDELSSRLLFGEDVRSSFVTRDSDLSFMKGCFFFYHQQFGKRLAEVRRLVQLSQEQTVELNCLRYSLLDLPQQACLACGEMVDRNHAIPLLEKLFPRHDFSQLKKLLSMAKEFPASTERSVAIELIDSVDYWNQLLYKLVHERIL